MNQEYYDRLQREIKNPHEPIHTEQWLDMLWYGEFSHGDILSLLAERDSLQQKVAELEGEMGRE